MLRDCSRCVAGSALCTYRTLCWRLLQFFLSSHSWCAVVHGKGCCFHSSGDISALERVPTFVLSQNTEGDGAPESCFFMPKPRITSWRNWEQAWLIKWINKSVNKNLCPRGVTLEPRATFLCLAQCVWIISILLIATSALSSIVAISEKLSGRLGSERSTSL